MGRRRAGWWPEPEQQGLPSDSYPPHGRVCHHHPELCPCLGAICIPKTATRPAREGSPEPCCGQTLERTCGPRAGPGQALKRQGLPSPGCGSPGCPQPGPDSVPIQCALLCLLRGTFSWLSRFPKFLHPGRTRSTIQAPNREERVQFGLLEGGGSGLVGVGLC